MAELSHPVLETRKIIKATVIALLIGIIILVTAVLPAEYGIDPSGAGQLLGFSQLYQPAATTDEGTMVGNVAQESYPLLKLEKAGSGPDVKRPIEADNPAPEKQLAVREDTVQVVVPAGKGIEYKVNMLKHGTMKYEWATDKGTAYFDFHGEVKEAKPTKAVYFESYTIAYSNNMIGTFLAPFEGRHGWFFRNNGATDMVINLRLIGEYELLK